MTDIFITSFYRLKFLKKTLKYIDERTEKGTYQIHIFDNGSDEETTDFLYQLLKKGKVSSIHLDNRNTGCLYNKGIFHMMVESSQKYYVVTDNDVYPPLLTPDWLSQMTFLMDKYEDVAFLAPQLPPIELQMPYEFNEDIAYCEAVGNTFKMVRRGVFPIKDFEPKLMAFGDDGKVCEDIKKYGYRSAFCRNIYCFHAGQCKNWGYETDQVNKDPRKIGYTRPFLYPIETLDTFEPFERLKIDSYIKRQNLDAK